MLQARLSRRAPREPIVPGCKIRCEIETPALLWVVQHDHEETQDSGSPAMSPSDLPVDEVVDRATGPRRRNRRTARDPGRDQRRAAGRAGGPHPAGWASTTILAGQTRVDIVSILKSAAGSDNHGNMACRDTGPINSLVAARGDANGAVQGLGSTK